MNGRRDAVGRRYDERRYDADCIDPIFDMSVEAQRRIGVLEGGGDLPPTGERLAVILDALLATVSAEGDR